jgi:hypothetical protein
VFRLGAIGEGSLDLDLPASTDVTSQGTLLFRPELALKILSAFLRATPAQTLNVAWVFRAGQIIVPAWICRRHRLYVLPLRLAASL